jgi:hypothetical protein
MTEESARLAEILTALQESNALQAQVLTGLRWLFLALCVAVFFGVVQTLRRND